MNWFLIRFDPIRSTYKIRFVPVALCWITTTHCLNNLPLRWRVVRWIPNLWTLSQPLSAKLGRGEWNQEKEILCRSTKITGAKSWTHEIPCHTKMLSQSLEWQKQGYVSMSRRRRRRRRRRNRNFVGNFLLSTNRSTAGRKQDKNSKHSKKLSRKSKNGSEVEANQTKPNQPRETKNKQNPGVSLSHSLSLLQQRKSNLCESNRLKHQQQQQQQAWRARSNLLVLMMIDQSSKHKSRECHRNSQIYRRRRRTTTTSPHTNKPIITFHPFLSSPAFHYLSPRLHLLPPTETSQPIPSEWCSDRVLRL